ncbi:hypothetical protein Rhopal_006535-T1 [Rhodotorula paludigena]|uniref:F-box domain-containing protein n=1 Tax=Rhodotorula paludigena TaxID=86838 RepID=A0AAV5GTC4_9BASI|nr:hypothetical protein Rhopal_006535-T1 [Rhodotorula paludigena]
MSATRDRQPRKATAARISYTEPASSSEDDGGDESVKPTRKAIKKRGKGMARADIETGVDDGYDDSDRPPAKARKPGKGRCANMAATVRSFGALPVELVIMILSYLDTPELLAFSKVDKQHRALMTSATMRDVWITAREKHDLPALSVGEFTEWQYAELVFGRKCFISSSVPGSAPNVAKRASESVFLVRSDELHEYVDLHPKTADCLLYDA